MSCTNTPRETERNAPMTRDALLMAQEFLHAWARSIEEPDEEACALIDAIDRIVAGTSPSNLMSCQ